MGGLNGITWQELEAVITHYGFTFRRQEGDHRSYVKPGALRPVVIPTYDNLPTFIIKKCLNTAGVTRRECLTFLGRQN